MYGLLLLLITMTTYASDLFAAKKNNDGLKSITIGKQTWMQENLDVKHYRNGDTIRYAGTDQEWLDAAAKGEGAWCYEKYGRLYNWYAVHDPRGLAPAGWRIPSAKDWETLSDALGGGRVAGGKMKSNMSAIWKTPNIEASNSSYFSALPGGLRGLDAKILFVGESAYFWTSSENAQDALNSALYINMNYHNANMLILSEHKADGMSIRCVRN